MNNANNSCGIALPSILELIAASISRTPSASAIEAPCGTITYAQLEYRACAVASAICAAGAETGAVVAVCLPRSIDQIVALLGAWKAGAAYLPLDPSWPHARLVALVEQVGCAAVIASPDLGRSIFGATPVVDLSGNFALDETPKEPSETAYVIATSGSSGDPKAVEVTHANLAALAAWHISAFSVHAGTRTSHLAGLGFDAAAWEVWPTLAAGGTVCLVDAEARQDPTRLRDWLVESRIEVAFAPTALAEPIVQLKWPSETKLRVLLTGADRLKVRPNIGLPFTFVNNYGPTECTVVATSGIVSAEGDGLPSIGRPIEGTTIHLLDPAGTDVPFGSTGEIHIGGAQVARRYRGDPDLTAARFVTHPKHGRLYSTGDLALWLETGELAFVGRMDTQTKIRGQRVEPAEVGAALGRIAEIQSCHVMARDGALAAYVVPMPGTELTASSLRTALAQVLPDYMIPAQFAQLDSMPLTANGKLDVRALPDPTVVAMIESAVVRTPSTPTEKRLFGIICDVLGHDSLGIDDDFFLVGGHSLLGTQVIVRARDAFWVEITLLHLFEAPTVAKLARTIEALVFAKIEGMSDEEISQMSA